MVVFNGKTVKLGGPSTGWIIILAGDGFFKEMFMSIITQLLGVRAM